MEPDSRMQTTTLGVAGGTASGKSTLVDLLQSILGTSVAILRLDDYYHDCSKLTPNPDGALNFDSIDAIDVHLYVDHLSLLKAGESVEAPKYDFSTHKLLDETTRIEPARVVIAEGLMVLAIQKIRELLDLLIYTQLDDDLRLLRRMRRDIATRDRQYDSVLSQWESTVRPFHRDVIEPSAQFADLVLSTDSFERVRKTLMQLLGKSSFEN